VDSTHCADSAAIIVAAGSGSRLPGDTPKQWRPLAGIPLIAHSFRFFDALPFVRQIVMVLDRATLATPERLAWLESRSGKAVRFEAGAPSRQESAWKGLLAVDAQCEIALVHDAARPFPPREAVIRAVEAARLQGGAILAVPVIHTIKRADDENRVVETLERSRLWAAQTPQVFRREPLMAAYRAALIHLNAFTDDASIFERAGGRVQLIPGSEGNLKITHEGDFELAERLLREKENTVDLMSVVPEGANRSKP
jgi:2-C-methyl-D-erythritol 4-phosphate cytidylyltransferase